MIVERSPHATFVSKDETSVYAVMHSSIDYLVAIFVSLAVGGAGFVGPL